jgi:carbonic anhydrase
MNPNRQRSAMIHCGINGNHFKPMKTKLNYSELFVVLIAALLAVTGCKSSNQSCCMMPGCMAGTVAAAVQTKESQTAMTPQQALAELKAGNERFVAGKPLVRDLPEEVKATAAGQYPFAVVLSCLDSRQPIEIVLDQGVGDIFSARVAGNVLDDDILGSMEFACKVSGAKLIAVIGHSNCGAIKGAVDNVELGNLTGLLAKIKPAIDAVPAGVQPRTTKNDAFVQVVSEENVKLVMRQIRERSPILREMLDQGQIELVGGRYDLATGTIEFYDRAAK